MCCAGRNAPPTSRPWPRFFACRAIGSKRSTGGIVWPTTKVSSIPSSTGSILDQVTPEQIDQLNRLDGASWTHPDPVMPEWARQLREAGFRTALLSNMPFTVRDAVLASANGCPNSITGRFPASSASPSHRRRFMSTACAAWASQAAMRFFWTTGQPMSRAPKTRACTASCLPPPGQLAAELTGRFDIPPPGVATLKEG